MAKPTVILTYQSNYNGISCKVKDQPSINLDSDPRFDALSNNVLTTTYEDCEEDGTYQGCYADLKIFILDEANKLFGGDYVFEVEIDKFST